MTDVLKGAHVEIVDDTGTQGGPLLPRRIRINGTDIGLIARDGVELQLGNHSEGEPCVLTITLYPSSVTIKAAVEAQPIVQDIILGATPQDAADAARILDCNLSACAIDDIYTCNGLAIRDCFVTKNAQHHERWPEVQEILQRAAAKTNPRGEITLLAD